MKQSMPSHVVADVESIDAGGENPAGASNNDLSKTASSGDERQAALGSIPAGEGSIRYRIAALIAMLLLALIGLAIWFYLRVT
jgi:hypothetical protein